MGAESTTVPGALTEPFEECPPALFLVEDVRGQQPID